MEQEGKQECYRTSVRGVNVITKGDRKKMVGINSFFALT